MNAGSGVNVTPGALWMGTRRGAMAARLSHLPPATGQRPTRTQVPFHPNTTEKEANR